MPQHPSDVLKMHFQHGTRLPLHWRRWNLRIQEIRSLRNHQDLEMGLFKQKHSCSYLVSHRYPREPPGKMKPLSDKILSATLLFLSALMPPTGKITAAVWWVNGIAAPFALWITVSNWLDTTCKPATLTGLCETLGELTGELTVTSGSIWGKRCDNICHVIEWAIMLTWLV